MNTKEILEQKNRPIIEQQNKVIAGACWNTCLNCHHWIKETQVTIGGANHIKNKIVIEKCGLFNAMPPPNVIVVGCERHENEIPF